MGDVGEKRNLSRLEPIINWPSTEDLIDIGECLEYLGQPQPHIFSLLPSFFKYPFTHPTIFCTLVSVDFWQHLIAIRT